MGQFDRRLRHQDVLAFEVVTAVGAHADGEDRLIDRALADDLQDVGRAALDQPGFGSGHDREVRAVQGDHRETGGNRRFAAFAENGHFRHQRFPNAGVQGNVTETDGVGQGWGKHGSQCDNAGQCVSHDASRNPVFFS
ncbi:MAG: hypothetical protein ACK4FP_07525 [Azonexus sp.]